eukprot:3260453-Rhodomonas_salina.1
MRPVIKRNLILTGNRMVRPHVALVLLITCGQVNSFLYPINLKSSSAAFSGCPHLMAPKSKVARPAGAVGVVMRGFDPSKKQSRNALNSGARHGAKRRLTSLRAAADANEKARFKRWIRGDEESRRKMWQEWRESLPPEQQQLALENEWLPWEEYDFDQRMTDRGVGHHDEEGKFVEREAGREIIWDKDPDGRFVLLQVSLMHTVLHTSVEMLTCLLWLLSLLSLPRLTTCNKPQSRVRELMGCAGQCPVEKLPICVLDKQRFLAEHPGSLPLFLSSSLPLFLSSLVFFSFSLLSYSLALLFLRSLRLPLTTLSISIPSCPPAFRWHTDGSKTEQSSKTFT